MFRQALSRQIQLTRPKRIPHIRCYSSNARQDPPKLRYIALVALVGSGAFVFSVNNLDKKMPEGITEEQYQNEKRINRMKHKRIAFSGLEVVFMVGNSGSGCTTQCEKLSQRDGYAYLTLDQLTKEQIAAGTKYGQLARRFVEDGRPVPLEVQIALVHDAMEPLVQQGHKKFVLDGFPESTKAAMKFEEDVAVVNKVVYLECPQEVLLKRRAARGAASPTQGSDEVLAMIGYFETSGRVARFSCEQKPDRLYDGIKKALA